tara:strand:+ start:180 stop:542 length:363 start_codon:yes stop_codon:yes gene_type:complete
MNRWSLLEHKIEKSDFFEIHYDFLLENGADCLTWKIFEIPKINGSLIKIVKQPNHRLVWLSREKKNLSRERGFVIKIDNGTYSLLQKEINEDNFSLILNGKLLRGVFFKKGNICQLISKD